MIKKILIIDDEKQMRNLIFACLSSPSFTMTEAGSGEEALQKIMEESYDLILLDIMMPNMSGFEVLREIRQVIDPDLPVVLLTALGDTENVVKGLNAGADDYIVKPFEPKELTARIESILRRSGRGKDEIKMVHGLHLNPQKFRVSYQGNTIPLTKKEFQVLKRLANHPGRVYTREQLLELEWGLGYDGGPRNVDAHIKNIREKLQNIHFPIPIIETVWGIGYQMIEE